MKRLLFSLPLMVTLVFASCSEPPPLAPPPAPTPLTVEGWKTLPIPDKYDEGSFERLRLQYPNLRSERAWRGFMVKVVIPERTKDIPLKPGTPATRPMEE